MIDDKVIQDIKQERRWFEKALLISHFHYQQCLEHPEKRPIGWTLQKSSDALGLSCGYISESLKLSREYRDRDVVQITRDEALARLKK